jgi:hypothetical protein
MRKASEGKVRVVFFNAKGLQKAQRRKALRIGSRACGHWRIIRENNAPQRIATTVAKADVPRSAFVVRATNTACALFSLIKCADSPNV